MTQHKTKYGKRLPAAWAKQLPSRLTWRKLVINLSELVLCLDMKRMWRSALISALIWRHNLLVSQEIHAEAIPRRWMHDSQAWKWRNTPERNINMSLCCKTVCSSTVLEPQIPRKAGKSQPRHVTWQHCSSPPSRSPPPKKKVISYFNHCRSWSIDVIPLRFCAVYYTWVSAFSWNALLPSSGWLLPVNRKQD
jgi:hypothetical protein